MFTVTMSHDNGIDQAWDSIKPAWNRFRTAFTKRFGKLRYVAILEPQPQSGYPHLHVLIDRFIPWGWCDAELQRAGFGSIKDFAYIRGRACFEYVCKYLRKPWPHEQGARAAVVRRMRRVSYSRGFEAVEAPSTGYQRFRKLLSEAEAIDLASLLNAEGVYFDAFWESQIFSGFSSCITSPVNSGENSRVFEFIRKCFENPVIFSFC